MLVIRTPAALRRLARDRGGVAMIEFAFTLPIVAGIGLYSLEIANYALTNMRVSQITLNLADNASRVGVDNSLAVQQLREVDVNDVLQAARYQGTGIKLTTYGRVTISSLENIKQTADSAAVLRIHWQRCIGLKSGANWDSTYGITATNNRSDGTTYDPTAGVDTNTGTADNSPSHPGSIAVGTTSSPGAGMGDTNAKVTVPAGSALMFVEVNYDYHPIVSRYFIGGTRMHYIASFIVRDNRDFTEIYNPSPTSTASTCDKHAA